MEKRAGTRFSGKDLLLAQKQHDNVGFARGAKGFGEA
jgi:hypothetical protein